MEQCPPIHCLGKCYATPSVSSGDERPRIEVHAPEAIVLANLVQGDTRRLSEYLARGGYTVLESALLATELAEIEPITVLQAQMRHADVRTTLKVYAHLIPQSQRDSMERIANRSIATNVPNGTRAIA
jgi:hypothetical protein